MGLLQLYCGAGVRGHLQVPTQMPQAPCLVLRTHTPAPVCSAAESSQLQPAQRIPLGLWELPHACEEWKYLGLCVHQGGPSQWLTGAGTQLPFFQETNSEMQSTLHSSP